MRTQISENQNSHHTSSKDDHSSRELRLRQEAEARLFEWEKLLPEALDLESSRRLLRELRVHQIELEIQNEELRRSQEELERSRSRYKDLYHFAPVGYLTINEAGLIIEANLTAAALLQKKSGALVNQPISRFIVPDDQDVYYHHRAAVLDTQERQSCKLRFLRKDDSPFWARLETVPTVTKGPDPPTCWIMLSDISEGMKSAEKTRRLEDQNRQQQKTESLERMAAAIAHYFNNQLTIVIGNLELAVDDLPKGTDTREYVISAMEGAGRAAEMSVSMLTYLGQARASHHPVDLAANCRTALENLRPLIPPAIKLTVDFPPDDIIVAANAGHIRQVVNNLVTNAWESHGGGEGAVQVRIQLTRSVDIPATHRFPVHWQAREGLYACLEVTDTGCGLETAEIDQIFDPFYTSKFIGRGLGLPLVMGIVRAHDGAITVTAKRGGGCVFRVFFPVYPVYRGAHTEIVSTPPQENFSRSRAGSEGNTILVVDDEPTILIVAREALSRSGYKVLTADSGNEAVALFRQHRESIRCVLCDLSMPGMDGWETLDALRRLDPGIDFILSSGYSQVQAMAGDHAEMPQSFLGKPYDLNELQQKIAEVVGKSKKED